MTFNRFSHLLVQLLVQLFCISAFGQVTPSSIDTQIDSLKRLELVTRTELNRINSAIAQLEQQKLANQIVGKYQGGVAIYCKVPTKLYEKRGTWSEVLDTVPKGYTLLAYDYKSNYYL